MRYFFWGLLSHLFRGGVVVELYYYFVLFVVERGTRLRAGRDGRPSLRFGGSWYHCALLFEDRELVVYAIVVFRLVLCRGLYALQLLPHLRWGWTSTRGFRVFDADAYNLFHLLGGYSATGFDLFLHRF